MTNLVSIIAAVKDKSLTKDQLEAYRDDLANITALLFLEMADLEKSEAIFPQKDEQETESARKRRWKQTEQGQRQIVVKNYIRASKEIIASLKSRLYSIY